MASEEAQRIKMFRESLGLTQREFAKEIGSSPGTVGNNEAGDKPPANPFVQKIVAKYGLSTDWLRTGKGSPSLKEPLDQQVKDRVEEARRGFEESLPPEARFAMQMSQAIQSLVPTDGIERYKTVEKVPSFDDQDNMAAIYEYPGLDIDDPDARRLWIDQLALSRYWLVKFNVTGPALLPVADDDMLPTMSKGDVVIFDTTDTGLGNDSKPRVVRFGGRVLIRRLKLTSGWVIMRGDNPNTMTNEIAMSDGAGVGLEILGRVAAVIKGV